MKIEEQVLSREQMDRLKELGVDTSDASMAWAGNDVVPNNGMSLDFWYDGIPTYTIGDLIEKLPKVIGKYSLNFAFSDDIYNGETTIHYARFENTGWMGSLVMDISNKEPLILSLFRIMVWVAKNHKELIK